MNTKIKKKQQQALITSKTFSSFKSSFKKNLITTSESLQRKMKQYKITCFSLEKICDQAIIKLVNT